MLDNHLQQRSSDETIIGYDIEGQPKYAKEMKAIYDEEVKNTVEENVYVTTNEIRKRYKNVTSLKK